jgi:hypothetical protein
MHTSPSRGGQRASALGGGNLTRRDTHPTRLRPSAFAALPVKGRDEGGYFRMKPR